MALQFENTILLSVGMRSWNNSKSLPVEDLKPKAETDYTRYRVRKTIMEADALKAICRYQSETVDWVKNRCIPLKDADGKQLLRAGIYALPLAGWEVVSDGLKARKAHLMEVLVPEFVAAYPSLRETEMDLLGDLANEADYPPPWMIAGCFDMTFTIMDCRPPQSMKKLDPSAYAEAQATMKAQLAEAAQAAVDAWCEELVSLTAHAREILTPTEDGRRRKIFPSLVGNWEEFLDAAPAKLAALDETGKLTSYIEEFRAIVKGVDTESLKGSEAMRVKLAGAMTGLQTKFETDVEVRKGRKIRFEDE